MSDTSTLESEIRGSLLGKGSGWPTVIETSTPEDPFTVRKFGRRLSLSTEQLSLLREEGRMMNLHIEASTLFAITGIERKQSYVRFIPPDPAQVAEYERLSPLWDEIRSSRLWYSGYDGGYLEEPQTRREIIYAETLEEYIARMRSSSDLQRVISGRATPAAFLAGTAFAGSSRGEAA